MSRPTSALSASAKGASSLHFQFIQSVAHQPYRRPATAFRVSARAPARRRRWRPKVCVEHPSTSTGAYCLTIPESICGCWSRTTGWHASGKNRLSPYSRQQTVADQPCAITVAFQPILKGSVLQFGVNACFAPVPASGDQQRQERHHTDKNLQLDKDTGGEGSTPIAHLHSSVSNPCTTMM